MNPYKVNKRNRRRVVVLFDDSEIGRIDQHGIEQRMPSRSEAIRQIVRDALNENGPVEGGASPSREHDLSPQ